LDYDGTDVVEAKATENYNSYGVLYNWPAAMNNMVEQSNSNPSRVQGVCPTGWHLPGTDEWKQLVSYLGGVDVAAKKLMESGTTHWQGDTGATNESGFTALPSGVLVSAWGVGFHNNVASWWTSTRNEYTAIQGYNSQIYFQWLFDWDYPMEISASGFSVRCVKD